MKFQRNRFIFFLFLSLLANFSFCPPLPSQERVVGEGEQQGFIINEGEQIFRVSPIKPGQTIQVYFTPKWITEKGGKVKWKLADQSGVTLRAASQDQPSEEAVFLEWTSNSEPRPNAYILRAQGMGGISPGEILGHYSMQIFLWDQNDGGSETDAPETFEKALLLPVAEPGIYLFDECFISGTADLYDIYRIHIKPNHSLTLKAQPLHWKGTDKRGKVRWEFLNKSFRRQKEGSCSFPQTPAFVVKVFHPPVRTGAKPALFYLLVKVEGEVSLIYSLQAEMREGP